jgi:putative SOS response-associated peptidase YedK
MCGRFTFRTPARDLVEIFELLREPELAPRYNIAPTQRVAVVRQSGKDREFAVMRWGLVSSTAFLGENSLIVGSGLDARITHGKH